MHPGHHVKQNTKGNPQPDIAVVEKYTNYCVLLVTRGFGGPQEILKWLHRQQESYCFDNAEAKASASPSTDDDGTMGEAPNGIHPQKHSVETPALATQAVIVSPHCKAYARSLVLAAKDKISLQRVQQLQLTIQCLCREYMKPNSEQLLEHTFNKQTCRLNIRSLAVARSNTLGHISLLAATNVPSSATDGTTIYPRQFRRQLKASGFPILGHTKDCQQFRGESLCMSVVKLQFQTDGGGDPLAIHADPAPRLRAIMEREERFWREKSSCSQPLNTDTDVQVVSKPPAYISGRAVFDGLEFSVNAAVMIPRAGSEAIVQRAVQLYEQTQEVRGSSHSKPLILDLGLGSGCLLLSLLHRLPHALGVGIDKSKAALDVATQNALSLGLTSRCTLKEGDFSQLGVLSIDHKFDVVVCNPPYHSRGGRQQIGATSVAHEPSMALFVEFGDMLVHYRNVLKGLTSAKLFRRGTVIVF